LEIEKPKRKLGLVLTRHCGYPSAVTVDSVIEGSCAAEAHPKIHGGDTLLAVDGKDVFLSDKMTLEDVKKMMQRASSKSIKLKLLHGDESYETELRLNPDNAGHGHGGAPAGAPAHDAPAHGHT
jgi:C-terminal processing protease CtpA/Prc